MPPDEVVIVLPVDPYTELRYYEMLSDMERAVKESRWDILLMGIKPESPPPKYGYIVPAAPRTLADVILSPASPKNPRWRPRGN